MTKRAPPGRKALIARRALDDLEGAEWLKRAPGDQEGDCEEDAEWLRRSVVGN